jgi:hypothetical protein
MPDGRFDEGLISLLAEDNREVDAAGTAILAVTALATGILCLVLALLAG